MTSPRFSPDYHLPEYQLSAVVRRLRLLGLALHCRRSVISTGGRPAGERSCQLPVASCQFSIASCQLLVTRKRYVPHAAAAATNPRRKFWCCDVFEFSLKRRTISSVGPDPHPAFGHPLPGGARGEKNFLAGGKDRCPPARGVRAFGTNTSSEEAKQTGRVRVVGHTAR